MKMGRLARNLPPQDVLEHFWGLGSLEEPVRIQAAADLLTHLANVQQSWTPTKADGAVKEKKSSGNAAASAADEALAHKLHPHVAYSLTRLVKGLPSSRQASRQGFTLALAHLMRLLVQPATGASAWPVLNGLITKHICAAPSDSATDEREKLFGRLFAVVAAVEAGLATSPEAVAEHVSEMVEHLLTAARGRAFLREPALNLLMRIASQSTPETKQIVIKAIQNYIPSPEDLSNPEDFSLCLYLTQCKEAAPIVLSKETIPTTVRELLLQTSSVAPRLHSAWPLVLAEVTGTQDADAPVTRGEAALPLVEPFWAMIDAAFMSAQATRRAIALQVFAHLMRRVPVAQFGCLLSPGFLRALESQVHHPDELFPHIKRCVRDLHALCVAEPALTPLVLAHIRPQLWELYVKPAEAEVETKDEDEAALDEAEPKMNVKGSKKNAKEDKEAAKAEAATQIGPHQELVQRLPVADISSFTDMLLERAMKHVHASDGDDMEGNNEEGQGTAANAWAVEALLSDAFVRPYPAVRAKVAQFLFSPSHATLDTSAWIQRFLAHACLAPEHPTEGLVALRDVYVQFPDADERVLAWVAAELPTTEGPDAHKAQRHEASLRALAMAAHMVAAQAGDERATSVVDEVLSVWERHQQVRSASPVTKGAESEDNDEAELHPMDVLADVLMELTAHPSAWMRRLCNVVFGLFAAEMTENTFDLMISALSGQGGADDDEDEDEEEMEVEVESDEESDDESDDDAVEVDGKDANGVAAEDEEDDDDEDDDDSEEQGGAAKRNVQLSEAITKALKVSGIQQTADDESDLDDDAMMALDGVMAAMLQKRNTKARKTEAIHFQYRVADLLGVYMKHREHATVTTIRTLLERIAETKEKTLANKLWHAMAAVKKIVADPEMDAAAIDEMMVTLIKGNLALAHPVLLKMFKAFSVSDAVVKVLTSDIKRYKSVLTVLAKTLPAQCGGILSCTVPMLTRRNANILAPTLTPLFDHLHTSEALKLACCGDVTNSTTSSGSGKKGKKSKSKAEASSEATREAPKTPAEHLTTLLVSELEADPKDVGLTKLVASGVRALHKCGGIDSAKLLRRLERMEAPKKQASKATLADLKANLANTAARK